MAAVTICAEWVAPVSWERYSPKNFWSSHMVRFVVDAVGEVDGGHGYKSDAQVADLREQPVQLGLV
jgi:hypothetical protein